MKTDEPNDSKSSRYELELARQLFKEHCNSNYNSWNLDPNLEQLFKSVLSTPWEKSGAWNTGNTSNATKEEIKEPTIDELRDEFTVANAKAEELCRKWKQAVIDEQLGELTVSLCHAAFTFREVGCSTGEIREGLVQYGAAHWDADKKECCLLVNRWQCCHTPALKQFSLTADGISDGMAPCWASGGLEFDAYYERIGGGLEDVQRFIKEQTGHHIKEVSYKTVERFKQYFADHCSKMMPALEAICQQPDEQVARKLDLT